MKIFDKINKKSVLYATWYSIITFLAILIYQVALGDNTQGAMCMPEVWQYGKIYQWVWGGFPCIYSLEFYFSYFFFTLLYMTFDVVRRKIMGFNPSALFRIYEGLGWFLINYGYLLIITKYSHGDIDFIMCLMALVGLIIFFLPLFLFFVLSGKI